MPRLRLLILSLLCWAVLAGAAASGQALASHSQLTYFEGSNYLLNPSTRAHAFRQLEALGVHALRVELHWANVVPSRYRAIKPPFDPTNPVYYEWSHSDAVITEARRLHWPVLLTIGAPAPRWATSNKKAPYITRPDDQAFQEFMTAVGRHYGSEVSLYSIWNEPNHPAFLLPQWSSNGTPASPRIYRGLWQAGYAGLQAAGIASPEVLFGETAPSGYTTLNVAREGGLRDVAPLAFLRGALCLNSRYHKAGSCSSLPIAGYAHHAYTKAVNPHYVAPGYDNVTIGTLARLTRALGLAERAGAIPVQTQIYLTEFGVQSKPNRQLGVTPAQQAEYDAISEHIAWSNPRVAAFSQYLLKDDPLGGAPGSSVHGGTVGFQTGLEYHNGSPKPLYFAWPLPLTVTRTGGGYALWGLVRASSGPTTVTILVRARGSTRYRTLASVATDSLGYWTLRSSSSGEDWRVRWTSPHGVRYEGPGIGAS